MGSRIGICCASWLCLIHKKLGGTVSICFLQNKTSRKFPLENQILISDLIYFFYFRHFDLKKYLAVAPAAETRRIENLVL